MYMLGLEAPKLRTFAAKKTVVSPLQKQKSPDPCQDLSFDGNLISLIRMILMTDINLPLRRSLFCVSAKQRAG